MGDIYKIVKNGLYHHSIMALSKIIFHCSPADSSRSQAEFSDPGNLLGSLYGSAKGSFKGASTGCQAL